MKAFTAVCSASKTASILLPLVVCAVVVRFGMTLLWYPHMADTLLHF